MKSWLFRLINVNEIVFKKVNFHHSILLFTITSELKTLVDTWGSEGWGRSPPSILFTSPVWFYSLPPNVDMGANFSTMNLSKFSKKFGFQSDKFTILYKFLYSIANFASLHSEIPVKSSFYPHIAIFSEIKRDNLPPPPPTTDMRQFQPTKI